LLLIKPGSFGDVIHALPCAAAIKRAEPGIELTWLVDERWQPLLAGNPSIDRTIVFPRQKLRGLGGKLKAIPWAASLRELQPEVALDLQGLLRSALMAKSSGAKRIVGLGDAREGARFFYDARTDVTPGQHAVMRYLESLKLLGAPIPETPEFWLPAGTEPRGLPPYEGYLLLHPFARGSGKSLSPAQVASLCRELAPRPVIVAGMGNCPDDLPSNALSLLNQTTISEMIWLIRHAAMTVSVDSGPMHIAAAVGAPLLSIHTWSDPRLVGPFGEAAWIWQGGDIRPQALGEELIKPPREPDAADIRRIAEWIRAAI